MVFIESWPFTRRLNALARQAGQELLGAIQNDLLKDPRCGVVIQGLSGIRKARAFSPTRRKGKRGGYRYLYLYLEDRQHIHLLYLLDKSEQEDLSTEERRTLRELVAATKKGR